MRRRLAYLEPMGSRAENAAGSFLTAEDLLQFLDHSIDDEPDAHTPLAFPLQARDLSGLSPAFVLTCGFDPLRDEGFAYVDRLREAGVDVEHANFESMVHGFLDMDIVDHAYDGTEAAAACLRTELDA
ncbi:alpha/beta hydrolase fold domain-containing protein [Halococcus hamelinensis]|uniref:Alpha/beta hydrolase n=1 Tax=Halococcus hamelinensis 100A6 TaxID=1132509 RepID=M0LZJ2_9EURY|nr:alpha/beta hydrolase fold domain-containing protein [Halococcus hamelinensis]EMA38866.1 alpha/beta hydrolase [Halococcus hamelinensis 100A6]